MENDSVPKLGNVGGFLDRLEFSFFFAIAATSVSIRPRCADERSGECVLNTIRAFVPECGLAERFRPMGCGRWIHRCTFERHATHCALDRPRPTALRARHQATHPHSGRPPVPARSSSSASSQNSAAYRIPNNETHPDPSPSSCSFAKLVTKSRTDVVIWIMIEMFAGSFFALSARDHSAALVAASRSAGWFLLAGPAAAPLPFFPGTTSNLGRFPCCCACRFRLCRCRFSVSMRRFRYDPLRYPPMPVIRYPTPR